jgi:hypothetical protein
LTNGVSYYENGTFHSLGSIRFSNLNPKVLYYANQDLSFDLGRSLGVLKITNGSIFGVDKDAHPVILKGQMTANFNSPAKIYAIKFDRYDLDLFQQRLNKFVDGTLPEDQYFLIQNIHTKFFVKNEAKKITVVSQKGEVSVKGAKIEEKIAAGRKIVIDKNNNIKKSIYVDVKIYVLIVIAAFGLYFIYNKFLASGGRSRS